MDKPMYRVLKRFFLALFPASVVGLENVPDRGSVIIASNHNSPLDGVWLWAIIRRITFFLIVYEVFRKSLLAPLLSWAGHIGVDHDDRYSRSNAYSGAMALQRAEQVLRSGGVIGIQPEGYCCDEGRLERIQPGVLRLALTTGTPIVPVGIRGGSRVMAGLGESIHPFRSVQLVVGRPIVVAGRTNTLANRQWLRAELMRALATLSCQLLPQGEQLAL